MMKHPVKKMTYRLFAALAYCTLSVFGVPINADAKDLKTVGNGDLPVIIEAESGQQGSSFTVAQDGAITYATTSVSYTGQSGPEAATSMITYQVTFQEPGTYNLFARLRVGPGGANDDSFFAAKGFGSKTNTDASGWVMVNGLSGAGFVDSKGIVNEVGTAGSEVWKWVNVTKNYFPNIATDNPFVVTADGLTKTFQIGSREDGLFIDKLAFGKADLFFTVANLDNVTAGSVEWPGDATILYTGPPVAAGSVKFLGNVKDWDDNNFQNIWNQITPGNEGKWASIGGNQDSTKWNWSGLDNLYNYARNNNMIFKDHTLVWGSQQPSWMNNLAKEEQLKYITTWIRQVGKRYPDMDLIDVVNESIATHNPPDGQNSRANYKEALGGDGATGYDWVIKAFELARKYIPNKTKLLLNDYGIINDNNATTTYLKIIGLLSERGLIDGIGVQCHRFEIQNANITTLKSNLDRLAATGLPIYISEMDLGDSDDVAPYDDQLQLEKYQQIFPIFWEHPSVAGVTLWGSLEDKMWQATCHLLNSDKSWRPAMKWLAQYIKDTPVVIDIHKIEIESYYYEPECAIFGSNWQTFSDASGSNKHYVTAKAGLDSKTTAPSGDENLVVIPFSVEAAGNFSVYARVKCPTADDDSFWLTVDDGTYQMANGLTSNGWEWKMLYSFSLTKGNHTLKIGYREDGALLDKISITNSPFAPSLLGSDAINICELPYDGPNGIRQLKENISFNTYPNPFSSYTNIDFALSEKSDVHLQVYDLMGREIATLLNKTLSAGSYSIKWNAKDRNGAKLGAGTYLFRLKTTNSVLNRKIVVVE